MEICGRYSLKYSCVIEEPPETDDVFIFRVIQMLGIRRVTICKGLTVNDNKIYIVLIVKQTRNKSNIIVSTYKV